MGGQSRPPLREKKIVGDRKGRPYEVFENLLRRDVEDAVPYGEMI